MLATQTTVGKFGLRDGDTPVDDVNYTTQAKAGVDGDPTEATSRPVKKTQHTEKYVDENHIIEYDPKNSEDDPEDEDPKSIKEKEDEYYYQPNPEVIRMAKKLVKTKMKLADQEAFSPQIRETLSRLEAIIELGGVAHDENIPDDLAPHENNATKKINPKDLGISNPTRDKQKDGQESDKNIEIWKIKKLIKALESARGNGTSMISLIMPPRDQISRVTKMLGDEFGTASNIKSRVNRQSVLGAITSAQQRLKLYNKVPPNGLVLYTGTIVTDDGKEKKVTIDFEPFKPINASLYLCDNKFHTEALNELLESDDKFGFIVMDGNGTLFGTLSGNTREVLHKFTVDLPKKHGRGGQSALRFARLRMEKRHNYVRKTAELATQFYINPATSQPNVSGLILAGSADFKTELSQSDMFDPRLQAKILNVVDVSYGGENGFNQAIELSAEILSNVKFIQEKRLIGKYFEEISQDTGKYVFGVDDTLKALEMGAVETLIVWENLDINRYVLKHGTTGEIIVKHLNKDQDNVQSHFRDPATAAELEVQEKMPLLEWFANEYKRFGCTLEFVTNKSQEGSQFCRGFGGIGGILRYQLDMRSFDDLSDDGEVYEDSD
uniref:eRF1/Pelota-like N-terminal domain-containing protein n=1 Tax=Cannabis sativa TaxID=3483 RepID=A0A803QKV5_CANSA